MTSILKLLSLVLLSVLLAGCQTTTTNLSVTKQPRNPTGLYPIELAWDTTQTNIRADGVKPYVIVDFNAYPMRPVPGLSNRFETVIPVPSSKNTVFYHFRVDFEYKYFGQTRKDSKLSSGYRLDIIDQ